MTLDSIPKKAVMPRKASLKIIIEDPGKPKQCDQKPKQCGPKPKQCGPRQNYTPFTDKEDDIILQKYLGMCDDGEITAALPGRTLHCVTRRRQEIAKAKSWQKSVIRTMDHGPARTPSPLPVDALTKKLLKENRVTKKQIGKKPDWLGEGVVKRATK